MQYTHLVAKLSFSKIGLVNNKAINLRPSNFTVRKKENVVCVNITWIESASTSSLELSYALSSILT